MSNADRTTLQIVEESTFGTKPGSGFEKVRFTSESLNRSTSTANSAMIRDDRNIADVVRTNVMANGDIGQEFSVPDSGIQGDLLEASIGAASQTTVTATVLNTTAVMNLHVYDASPSGDIPTHGFEDDTGTAFSVFAAGEWIRCEPANNTTATDPMNALTGSISGGGYFKIKEVTASGGSLELEGSKITADDTMLTTGHIREEDSNFKNGVAERSFSIEKMFNDLTADEGESATRMTVGSFNLSVSPESIVTNTFTFMGKDVQHLNTITAGGSAASTQKILSAVDNVAGIYIKTGTTGEAANLRPLDGVTSFDLTIENNLRTRTEIGELGAQSIGQGSINVSGSLTVYYDEDSGDIAENIYEGFEDSAISIVLEEAKVNEAKNFVSQGTKNPTPAIIFEMPKVKITSLTRNATGTGSDVMAEIGFTAFYDPSPGLDGTVDIHLFT